MYVGVLVREFLFSAPAFKNQEKMVRYVDRARCSDPATVCCFRCGGNHFAKNKLNPSKNCKAKPALFSVPLCVGASVQNQDCKEWPALPVPKIQQDALLEEIRKMSAKIVSLEQDLQRLIHQREDNKRASRDAAAGPDVDQGVQVDVCVQTDVASVVVGVDAEAQVDVCGVSVQTDAVSVAVGVDAEAQVDVCGVSVQTDAVSVAVGVDAGSQVDVCGVSVQTDAVSVAVGVDAGSQVDVCGVSVQTYPASFPSSSIVVTESDPSQDVLPLFFIRRIGASRNKDGDLEYPCDSAHLCEHDGIVSFTYPEQVAYQQRRWKPPASCYGCRRDEACQPSCVLNLYTNTLPFRVLRCSLFAGAV